MNDTQSVGGYCVRAFFFISMIICLVYSNSLLCGWHFDDSFNIYDNVNVTISSLTFENLLLCIKNQGFNRPLSYVSFAINWGIGRDNVAGYHLVNIAIHIGCSFLLYVCMLEIISYSIPQTSFRNRNQAALLASVLWAIHPINIQAVTYIVQRMTSLSALFYLSAMLYYLKKRRRNEIVKCWHWCGIIGLVFLSFASKQNGVLTVMSFVLVEFIFFRDQYSTIFRKKFDCALIVLGLTGILLIGVLINLGFFSYESRNFSLVQRMLTQANVVFLYLSLIFYPMANRFSIAHDYTLSTSLLFPTSTVFALIGLILIVYFCIILRKRYPIAVFSVLFFFLNHLVESTFIPLEMIFEHRNYLPMMFLFVPLSLAIVNYLEAQNRTKKIFYCGLGSILIVSIGLGTYGRNFDWQSEKTLWRSAMNHSSGSARSHQNLANTLPFDSEVYLKINKNAEHLWDDTVNRAEYVSLSNQILSLSKMERFEEALIVAERLMLLNPENIVPEEKLIVRVLHLKMKLKQYKGVIDLFNQKIRSNPKLNIADETLSIIYLYAGSAAVKLNMFDLAYENGMSLLKRDYYDERAYALLVSALIGKSRLAAAEHFMRQFKIISSDKILSSLLDFELAKAQNDKKRMKTIALALRVNSSIEELIEYDSKICYRPLFDNGSIILLVDENIDKTNLQSIAGSIGID